VNQLKQYGQANLVQAWIQLQYTESPAQRGGFYRNIIALVGEPEMGTLDQVIELNDEGEIGIRMATEPDIEKAIPSNHWYDSEELPPLITNADRYSGINVRYDHWHVDLRTCLMQAASKPDIPKEEVLYWTILWFRGIRNMAHLMKLQEESEATEESDA
jgi:hypothetical protein